jgi:putative addiction module antidote
MIKETTLRAVGNSAGTTIPKAMLDRLHVGEGDKLYIVEVDNGILLTPFDPTFRDAMEAYEEGFATYRNALKELAEK